MTTPAPQSEAPVRLVPYDPSWPSLFEAERTVLEGVLGPWLAGSIEHVGSTAVPGLLAKPVIDIMAAVHSLDASRPAISVLVHRGWFHFPYRADVMHWFGKPSPAFRTHHLHLVPFRSPLWIERLAFRDCLRCSPAVAAEYAALKQSLAQRYEFDREAYTEAKGPFVQQVLSRLVATPDR
jgi:GrpB-like predicted nucleotidyltransferase (UPF0157 family)